MPYPCVQCSDGAGEGGQPSGQNWCGNGCLDRAGDSGPVTRSHRSRTGCSLGESKPLSDLNLVSFGGSAATAADLPSGVYSSLPFKQPAEKSGSTTLICMLDMLPDCHGFMRRRGKW